MPKKSFEYICICIAILAFVNLADAQYGSPRAGSDVTETARGNTPTVQSATLENGRKQVLDFVVRIYGSVSGRIFLNDGPQSPNSTGISGVKVTLRSRDAGFENFRFEQFTDANGMYSFLDLRPGKYMIEIDPKYLPTDY